MPTSSTTNEIEADGEMATAIECALLDLTDKVFTYSKAELRAVGRQFACQLLQSTRESKLNVRTYVGLALILSSLTSMRLTRGSEVACQYLDAIKGPMELVCSMPWEFSVSTPTTGNSQS